MSSTPGGRAGAAGPAEEGAVRELHRVLDRLAALGPGRLARPGPRPVGAEVVSAEPARPVDVVRPLLQQLADEAAHLEGRSRRDVPELASHALGDQLAVLAGDVLAAARAGGDVAATGRLHQHLTRLRRAL
ncbi:hypothetical protein [Pseudokineococcus sp. 1T1Z-3]|uniref:hypothetical protein n=1 Tax=Pseudokineococcus sp. 1T1Z-3 TaxID=3132745 RepID=UPI0030AF8B71